VAGNAGVILLENFKTNAYYTFMIMTSITLARDIDYATAFKIKKLSSIFAGTEITILYFGKLVSGNNILNLLALAAKTGTPCLLIASGDAEAQAIEELKPVLTAPDTAPTAPSKRISKTSPK
jgi:phosphotransferase system HPr-like phosphotransfer protein